jgi:hypothetical protein
MLLAEDQNMIQARAEAFRSGVQHMDSARATSAMLAGRESPSPEVDA